MSSPTRKDAGSSIKLFNSTTLAVDDASNAIIYSSGWKKVLTGSNLEFNASYNAANTAGANATFTFNGTGIEIYGFLESLYDGTTLQLTPVVQFVIDNSTPFITRPSIDANDTSAVFATPIYVSPPLLAGEHTLTVTCLNTTRSSFGLNYLVYTPSVTSLHKRSDSSADATSTSISSDQSPFTSIIHSSIPLASIAPEEASDQSSTASNAKSLSAGAIAGATIGGFVLLLLVVVTALWCRRRHRRSIRSAWVRAFETHPGRYLGAPPNIELEMMRASKFNDAPPLNIAKMPPRKH